MIMRLGGREEILKVLNPNMVEGMAFDDEIMLRSFFSSNQKKCVSLSQAKENFK